MTLRGGTFAILGCALTACGAGSGGIFPRQTTPGGPASRQPGSVTLTISIPRAPTQTLERRPAYVSPATQSVSVSPAGAAAQTFALTPSSPNCASSSGTLTCTLSVSVPTGQNEIITIATYSNTAGTGTPLSTAMVVTDVVSGQSNPVNATLNGVAASLAIALNPSRVTPGTAATVQVIVNALDASGNTIVGPGIYADAAGNPVTITLSDTDPSNSTALSQSAVTKPTSAITLAYNGSHSFSSATVTAALSNAPSKSANLGGSCDGDVRRVSHSHRHQRSGSHRARSRR